MQLCSYSSDSPYPVGCCMNMCPEAEIFMRQNAGLVHPLEEEESRSQQSQPSQVIKLTGQSQLISRMENKNREMRRCDRSKMVKAYRRPAAGRNDNDPLSLRPFPVLQSTTLYLTESVAKNSAFKWDLVYQFVSDRLRAVRQDMIIQSFNELETACLLEAMLEFYLNATYRCETTNCSSYDRKLHFSQMDEVISRIRSAKSLLANKETRSTSHHWKYVDLIYRCREPRVLEEWIKYHEEAFKFDLKEDPLWKLTGDIISSVRSLNFVRFFRVLKSLPRLLQLAAWIHVEHVRRSSLDIIAKAFKAKNLGFPIFVLTKWLAFDTENDAAECCRTSGFTVKRSLEGILEVCFEKNSAQETTGGLSDSNPWNRIALCGP